MVIHYLRSNRPILEGSKFYLGYHKVCAYDLFALIDTAQSLPEPLRPKLDLNLYKHLTIAMPIQIELVEEELHQGCLRHHFRFF